MRDALDVTSDRRRVEFDQAALTDRKAALLLQIAAIMSTVSLIGKRPVTWAGAAAWTPRTLNVLRSVRDGNSLTDQRRRTDAYSFADVDAAFRPQ